MNNTNKLQYIQSLLQSHHTKQARPLIDQLIHEEPNNVEVWYYRGVCERFEGELDLAENDFRSVVQQKQNHARAFFGLGDVLEHKGNLKEAILAYHRAASLGNQEAAKKLAKHGVLRGTEQKAVSLSCQYKQSQNLVTSPNLSLGLELKTERRIDYTRLRDLLAAGNWDIADQETEKLMLQAAGKNKLQWGTTFPCVDLQTINNLWTYYSKGRFGFSVQQEIWRKKIEGGRKFNRILWERFGHSVGWFYKGLWLCKSEISFDDSAPKGHLPAGMWAPSKSNVRLNLLAAWWMLPRNQMKVKAKKRETGWHGEELISLLSRLEMCNSPNSEEIENTSSHATTIKKLNDFQIILANPFQALFVHLLRLLGFGLMFFVFIIVASSLQTFLEVLPPLLALVLSIVLSFLISCYAFGIYQITIDKLLRIVWKETPILNDKFSKQLRGIWRGEEEV